MPTVNEVLGGVLQNALAHPKTTVQSVLTSAMFLTAALLGGGVIHGRAAAIAGVVQVCAKILVGMMQTDSITLPPNTNITGSMHITTPAQKEPLNEKS